MTERPIELKQASFVYSAGAGKRIKVELDPGGLWVYEVNLGRGDLRVYAEKRAPSAASVRRIFEQAENDAGQPARK